MARPTTFSDHDQAGDSSTASRAPLVAGPSGNQCSFGAGRGTKKMFPLFDASRKSKSAVQDAADKPTVISSDDIMQEVHGSRGKERVQRTGNPGSDVDSTRSTPPPKRKGKAAGMAKNGSSSKESSTSTKTSHSPSVSRPVTPPPSTERRREVIEITDSPVRELAPTKTFDDLKAEREAKKAIKQAGGWFGGLLPPWPPREACHVGMERHAARLEDGNTARKWKGKGRAIEADPMTPNSIHQDQAERLAAIRLLLDRRLPGVSEISSVKLAAAEHHFPIFERLSMTRPDPDLSQLYSAKYAPACVAEVLGGTNLANAQYLKRWLQRLTLEEPADEGLHTFAPAKRKIQREVSAKERKRRKKTARRQKRKGANLSDDDDLQDFIASNSEEEHERYDYFDLNDDDGFPSPTKSDASTSSAGRMDALTNVILLCGPTASGKTSTVHGIAKELGWQVFEVYPGIGKRGAKDIDKYVGMIGQNHIVKKEQGNQSGLAGIFRKAASQDPGGSVPGANGQIRVSESPVASLPKIAQSVVLIEEVDLLYPSDQGFWDGVIAFISKSRRPVILTCNDPRSIPFQLLPLQTTLHFEQVTAKTAISFLFKVASAEKLPVSFNEIGRLCAASKVISDDSAQSGIDLRHALNSVQLMEDPATALAGPVLLVDANKETVTLKSVQTAAECLSFANAEVERRSFMQNDDMENTLADVEDRPNEHLAQAYTQLGPALTLHLSRPLPAYAREADLTQALTGSCELPNDTRQATTNHCLGLQPLLSTVLDECFVTSNNARIFVDTLPYVRSIVETEDIFEVAYHESLAHEKEETIVDTRIRRSRRLAEAGREAYPRHLALPAAVLSIIRSSG